jgi:hypothetical protein
VLDSLRSPVGSDVLNTVLVGRFSNRVTSIGRVIYTEHKNGFSKAESETWRI